MPEFAIYPSLKGRSVFVSGGGCSGLQNGMAIAEEVEEGDAEDSDSDV